MRQLRELRSNGTVDFIPYVLPRKQSNRYVAPLRGMVVYGPWACITLLFLRAGIFSSFFIGSYVENSMNIRIDDLEKMVLRLLNLIYERFKIFNGEFLTDQRTGSFNSGGTYQDAGCWIVSRFVSFPMITRRRVVPAIPSHVERETNLAFTSGFGEFSYLVLFRSMFCQSRKEGLFWNVQV